MPRIQSPLDLPYYLLAINGPDTSGQQAVLAFVENDAPAIDATSQDAAAQQIAATLQARDDVTTVTIRRIDTATTTI